jgi:hypothetical protein
MLLLWLHAYRARLQMLHACGADADAGRDERDPHAESGGGVEQTRRGRRASGAAPTARRGRRGA